jgi:hypothetical protein
LMAASTTAAAARATTGGADTGATKPAAAANASSTPRVPAAHTVSIGEARAAMTAESESQA